MIKREVIRQPVAQTPGIQYDLSLLDHRRIDVAKNNLPCC